MSDKIGNRIFLELKVKSLDFDAEYIGAHLKGLSDASNRYNNYCFNQSNPYLG
jgi:hypothetical protein